MDGLLPTFKIIKHTKKIAIANKETIICAWNLIKKKLKKNNTEFIPVDSEHFSIWYALQGNSKNNIDKLYLTASGGPLLNISLNKFKNLKISKIINHPISVKMQIIVINKNKEASLTKSNLNLKTQNNEIIKYINPKK